MSAFVHPEMLVDTARGAAHARDPNVRLVDEVDVDTTAYDQGHVPGAIAWNWTSQLCDTVRRDVIPKEQFEQLMAESGIGNDITAVLYGDNNNWFAAWALWQMKLYCHKDVRLMDGGRKSGWPRAASSRWTIRTSRRPATRRLGPTSRCAPFRPRCSGPWGPAARS